ncbi:MAG: PAS domain S-box protein [Prochloraceae cyanobacterium]
MNQNSNFEISEPSQDRKKNQQIQLEFDSLKQHSDVLESQPRSFLAAITQIVWRGNLSGEIVYLNQQWQDYTGLSVLESLGLEFVEAIHQQDRDRFLQAWQIAREKQLPLDTKFRLRQKDGTYHHFIARAEPIKAEGTQILEWLGTYTSISKLEELETELQQKQQFLQTVLANLFDGIIICDAEGIITLFNRSSQELHGLSSQPISVSHWADKCDLYLPDGKTKMKKEQIPLYRALQGECFHELEMIVIPQQGKPRTLLTSGAPLITLDGKKLGAFVAVRDITQRQQAKAEVVQLNEELEKRVIQRTSQLETTNRFKDELLLRERTARQEAELAKTKTKLYEDIVNNIQIGFCIWHLEDLEDIYSLRLVAANPASSKVLDVHLDTDIGKKIGECFPKMLENNQTELETYAEVVHSQKAIEFDEVPYGDDRVAEKIFNIKAFPLPDNCVGIAFENITERKLIEKALIESMRQYRSVVNSVREVIFQTDTTGCWQFLNSAWTKITGFTILESLNEPFTDYIYTDKERMRSRRLFQSLITGEQESFQLEFPLLTKNKDFRTLEMNIQLNYNAEGKVLGTTGTINDITERKQAEAALQVRANELSQINTMLLRTTAQLEKRNQELDQFAYVTSHDLKAPLRAIANLSEWIEEDLDDKLDEDTRQQMNLLRGRVHRMENLINGLLQYSRVGRISVQPESADVNLLLAEVIDSLAPPPEFAIKIVGQMPTLMTERLPLEQVFSNLISNAIKHHHRPDGIVEICVQDQGNFYEFSVTDDGPGIAREYHEKVFVIFQILEARDKVENTGIGLSIVKKIVESQGGKIKLISQPGQGTTFRFTWRKS